MSVRYKGDTIANVGPSETKVQEMIDNSVSQEEVYSTEEIRIGTWIDGKPLYRKVFSITSPPAVSTSSVEVAKYDANVDTVVRLDGLMINASGVVFPIPPYDFNAKVIISYGLPTNNGIQKNTLSMIITRESECNRPCIITMEYTKTTDTAPASLLSTEETALTSEVEFPTTASVDGNTYDVSFPSSVASASSSSASINSIATSATLDAI